MSSGYKFMFADVYFNGTGKTRYMALGIADSIYDKTSITNVHADIYSGMKSKQRKENDLYLRLFYKNTNDGKWYYVELIKRLTNNDKKMIDTYAGVKKTTTAATKNNGSTVNQAVKLDCPTTAMVNEEFKCNSTDDGVTLKVSTSNLAKGYSSSWTTKKNDYWIRAKYTKEGKYKVVATKNGKTSSILVTVSKDGSEGSIKKETK